MEMKTGMVLAMSLVALYAAGIGMAASAVMSPKDILRKADEARGNLEGVTWTVKIDSVEKGREQHRSLKVKAKGYNFLAIMLAPSKVKGQKLLMVDHNMWYMKPGLRKPVPVSPRQKLVGGAAYGDIAATNYADDYDVVHSSEESLNGEKCYVYDLKAAEKKATYDRIKYWVSESRLVGLKAEYYTVSGKLLKTAAFEYDERVEINHELRPFISKMIIKDALIPDNVTIMIFSEPVLMSIPDSVFDLNFFMMR